MRHLTATLAAGLALALLPATPSQAILNGTPDANTHPYAGEIFLYVPDEPTDGFDDPGAWFSCSAALVSPTVVVTAGHCTYAIGLDGASTITGGGTGSGGNDVWLSLAETPDFGIVPPSSDFGPSENAERYAARSAALDASTEWLEATAFTHPAFDNDEFVTHDLGVLMLDEPVTLSEYADLPPAGLLDGLGADRSQTYTAVGYGIEDDLPRGGSGGDRRLFANLVLRSLRYPGFPPETAAKFADAPGGARQGTCIGDSGGPVLVGDSTTLVGVVSFRVAQPLPTCRAGSGVYRIDQADDLAFLATFGVTP
jgi:hypothetical protein